jgi:hypothetical protein
VKVTESASFMVVVFCRTREDSNGGGGEADRL